MVTKIKTEVHALYAAAAVEGRDDGCRGNALDALRELCNFIAGPETQSPTARLREKEHAAAVRRAPAVSAQVGRPGYFCLPTSPHTLSQSPTSPTSSRSVINELRLEEAAKRGDMDRVARLAVEILRLAQQGDREGVLEVISDRGSPRLPSMAEKAAARAERGDDKGEKVDDRFKRSGHRLTPSGFDLQCDMQPESATPSESLPPPRTPTRDREHLQSALDYGQTPSSEQDRSSPPPPPGKIPPDMLEKAELWARLERLDLLHRLDSRGVRDSAVSTRSSSLRPPALDHEHLHDMHAPPSQQDRARWSSAGYVGVTIHQQRDEHAPDPPAAQSLVSMITKINVAVDTLRTASALYDRARKQTPADDAGMVAPGPHGGRNAHEAQSATDNTEYSSEQPAAPSIRRCGACKPYVLSARAPAHTDSGLSECVMRANSSAMEEWPDHQEVCGELTLKGKMDSRTSMRAKCSMDRCMLTLTTPRQSSRDASGGEIQSNFVQISVEELAVRLPQDRTDAFEIGTLHENRIINEICCFADNQSEQDKWIATFRRMGVAIFD